MVPRPSGARAHSQWVAANPFFQDHPATRFGEEIGRGSGALADVALSQQDCYAATQHDQGSI
jgi:hypothetical protein